jgi:hypothetical protein
MKPMPTKVPFVLVRVEWIDAEADPDWVEEHDIDPHTDKMLPVRSVGYQIRNNKKWVIVAGTLSWCHTGWLFTNIMRIPRGMVNKIERL